MSLQSDPSTISPSPVDPDRQSQPPAAFPAPVAVHAFDLPAWSQQRPPQGDAHPRSGDPSPPRSRPSTGSHPPSSASSAFAQSPPPDQRPPSAHSSASAAAGRSTTQPTVTPQTTPQHFQHSQPSLFPPLNTTAVGPPPATSPLSPPYTQTFFAATPRAPPGQSLGRTNGSTGSQGDGSGNESSAFPFRHALEYDALLGPAPGSTFSQDRSSDGRSRSDESAASSGAGFGGSKSSRSSSESGSGGGSHRPHDSSSSSSAAQVSSGGGSDFASSAYAGQSASSSGFSNSHPSSSSLASSAGLVSPLSPHVEPFSPSTSNGGSWGFATSKIGGQQQQSNSTTFGNGSSTQDFRGFAPLPPPQQQQQQPTHFARPSLPSFSPDPSSSIASFMPQQQAHVSAASDRDRERKYSLPPLALGGVPEHGYPQTSTMSGPPPPLPFPSNHYEVPGLPPLHTSLAPLQNYFGPGPALNPVPVNQYGSDNESGYGSGSGGGNHQYSSAMSAGGSRDGFASGGSVAGLGLQSARREIPTDRGGYVRAGYELGSANNPRTGDSRAPANTRDVDGEEISTIFVVGFPDDMMEREFQNMFIFSHGFEAATLKIPATVAARERDRELATAAAVNAVVGGASNISSNNLNLAASGAKPQQQQGGPPSATLPAQTGAQQQSAYLDPYGGMLDGASYEDAFGNLPLDGPGSLAQVLGIASRDGSGSPAAGIARKQIIGFAKFRTRTQALDARDLLSGKRVDAEKGCILKAEMAKKNLHTKRGLSNELLSFASNASFPLSALDAATLGRLASATNLNPAVLAELARQSAVQQAAQQQANSNSNIAGQANGNDRDSRDPRDAFNSFQSPASSSGYAPREREVSSNYARSATSHRGDYYDDAVPTPTSPQLHSSAYPALPDPMRRAYSQDRASGPPSDGPPDFVPHSPTSSSSVPASSPHLRNAMLQSAYSGNSMMQQLDEHAPASSSDGQRHPLNPPHRSFSNSQFGGSEAGGSGGGYASDGQGHGRERAQSHVGFNSQPLYQTFSSQSSGNSAPLSNGSRLGNITGPSLAAPPMGLSISANGIPRTQNPADMNAPKNTLYVGGLPAVLPSLTGPFSASHLEDSLRNAFSRCAGFRRLCFRSKSNGPIVFVEFDDVMYATQALQDMYGHTLGGLIKGGIRLSYSKNPLGVRSTNGLNGSPLAPALSDGTFPHPNSAPYQRRPSESVFGPAAPSLDWRSSMPHSPPVGSMRNAPPLASESQNHFSNSNNNDIPTPQFSVHSNAPPSQFSSSSSFSPFSFDH